MCKGNQITVSERWVKFAGLITALPKLSWVVLLALLSVVPVSFAETALPYYVVTDDFSSQDLENYIEYFIDPTREVQLDDIIGSPEKYPFISLKEEGKGGNNPNHHTWVRIRLKFESELNDVKPIYIYNNFSRFYEFIFYDHQLNGEYKEMVTGSFYPFDSRPYVDENFQVRTVLQQGMVKEYYFRLRDSAFITHFSFSAYDELTFYQHRFGSGTFFASFYAVMLALFGYNLFLAFFSGVSHYKYYVVFMVPSIAINLMMDGTGFRYLWGDYPQVQIYGTCVSAMLAISCYVMFTRHFLSTGKYFPGADKFLMFVQYFTPFILLSLFFIEAHIFEMRILGFYNFAIFGMVFVVCLRATMIRIPSAGFFIVAELALMVGGLGHQLYSSFGLFEESFFTIYGLQLGTGAEVLLLSVAIADRIKRMGTEKELYHQQALQAAESSNQLKNEFLSTISHELRTPMNGVMGNIDILKDTLQDLQESNESKSVLSNLSRSADDMMLLVDRILGFTEIHAGQLQVANTPFSLQKTIQPLVRHYADRCHAKGLEFVFDSDRSVQDNFMGDSRKLLDVLDALLDNALKFTHSGSIIFRIKALTTLNDQASQMLMFQVKDSGCGIPKEDIETLFTAFKQGDGSYSREFGGLGLGLAFCRVLAELLGGTIDIESDTDQGCLVNLQICLDHDTSEETQAIPTQAHVGRFSSGGKHVLVVEDNATNQVVLKTMLVRLGYEVSLAENGKLALDWINKNTPDLILMDCQMPVMDGFEATKRIRNKKGAISDVPILAVTANVLSGDRERCIQSGMNDYIKKPISKSVIEEKLSQWLG